MWNNWWVLMLSTPMLYIPTIINIVGTCLITAYEVSNQSKHRDGRVTLAHLFGFILMLVVSCIPVINIAILIIAMLILSTRVTLFRFR